MNLNKSWKSVLATTASIFLFSFVLGMIIHEITSPRATGKTTIPEGYMQQISAMPTISVEDAYGDFSDNNAVFIDARDNAEYVLGHIKGAINIPDDQFKQDEPHYKALLTRGKKIITYCHGTGCGLSVDVAKKLMAMGYSNVYVMTEGWPGWINANLPITVGKEP